MKNTLILLAIISSFVLVGCPKEEAGTQYTPTDGVATEGGSNNAKVDEVL